MKHRWTALLIVLASSAIVWSGATGQGAPPSQTTQRMAGTLGQNFPNPFNPETTIPFSLGLEGNPPTCRDPSRLHRVSLTIRNILGQVAAIPILQGGGEHAGQPVENLVLRCGEYRAFWDGTLRGSSQKAPSMPYLYILEVDGVAAIKRMYVKK